MESNLSAIEVEYYRVDRQLVTQRSLRTDDTQHILDFEHYVNNLGISLTLQNFLALFPYFHQPHLVLLFWLGKCLYTDIVSTLDNQFEGLIQNLQLLLW